jgi:hypothetical protein
MNALYKSIRNHMVYINKKRQNLLTVSYIFVFMYLEGFNYKLFDITFDYHLLNFYQSKFKLD